MVNILKHCSNLQGGNFTTFLLSGKDFQFEKVTLSNSKNLRLFVHRSTADDKYSLLNRDNLTQPIQMILSPKKKPFLNFSSAVSKSK